MLRNILIILDGSDDGTAAVDLGVRWAKECDATLVGMAIVDEPGILSSGHALLAQRQDPPELARLVVESCRQAGELVRDFARRCDECGVRCRITSEVGTPYVEILREAQRCNLIVLEQRTHYDYGWKDQADETLADIMRDSSRPVVVVPRSPIGGERVAVVAYDGSLQASRALGAFEASGLARSRTVHVVSVAPHRSEAFDWANRAVSFLRAHGVDAHGHPVESVLEPADEIGQKVLSLDAGLLVMGAYGQQTLQEFSIGSVTRTLLRWSPVPIFCSH